MRTKSCLLTVVAIAGVFGGAACSSDQPAVCDSLAAVQNTADHIRDTTISENGVTQLQADLRRLASELQNLYSDAQAQFPTELNAVRTAANQFSTTVAAAHAAPSAANLSAVRTSRTLVQQSLQNLGGAMSGTC
jgi:Tfp pilus assembly protein PilE